MFLLLRPWLFVVSIFWIGHSNFALAQEPNHACDAECQRIGRLHEYGTKPGQSSRSNGAVDPVDEAIGNMFIDMLAKKYREDAARKREAGPSAAPATRTPQIEPDSAVTILQGVAVDERGRKRWPFRIEVTAIGDRGFSGKILWPTLRSVHRIEGTTVRGQMYFREISAIQRGSAVLGCEYWSRSDTRIDIERPFETTGNYRCDGSAGRFSVTNASN